MTNLIGLLTACAMLGCAVLVLWANPRRLVNHGAFAFLTLASLWLGFRMISWGAWEGQGHFRTTVSIGAWAGGVLWLFRHTITAENWPQLLRRTWMYLAASLVLSLLPWSNDFVGADSSTLHPHIGYLYYVYVGGVATLSAGGLISAWRESRRVQGSAKIELQLIGIGGGALVLMLIVRMLLAMAFPRLNLNFVPTLSVFATAVAVTWACAAHKILEAHQLFRSVILQVALVLAVAGVCYGVIALGYGRLPLSLLCVAVGLVAVAAVQLLKSRLEHWFFHAPGTAAARTAAHAAGSEAVTAADGVRRLEEILSDWAKSAKAHVAVFGPDDDAVTSGWTLAADSGALRTLQQLRWVTPERLERERSGPGRAVLGKWLETRGLAAAVVHEGSDVSVLVAVGQNAAHRPFTYPQITELFEFAAIAEAVVVRLRLTEQAVQSEKLATVGLLGAALAHEIRNPLYAIRSFVEMLPTNYDEQEFRTTLTKMAGAEIVRIDRLISRLANLAKPREVRVTTVRLHEVIVETIELMTPKARAELVTLETILKATDDRIQADADSVKQVLLNLCLNAIQAQQNQALPRWARFDTRKERDFVELRVRDGGPGIAAEIRPKLFRPFQSATPGGLGLGLSISRDTLAIFGATIECETADERGGAVFVLRFLRPEQKNDSKMLRVKHHGHATDAVRPGPSCVAE